MISVSLADSKRISVNTHRIYILMKYLRHTRCMQAEVAGISDREAAWSDTEPEIGNELFAKNESGWYHGAGLTRWMDELQVKSNLSTTCCPALISDVVRAICGPLITPFRPRE